MFNHLWLAIGFGFVCFIFICWAYLRGYETGSKDFEKYADRGRPSREFLNRRIDFLQAENDALRNRCRRYEIDLAARAHITPVVALKTDGKPRFVDGY